MKRFNYSTAIKKATAAQPIPCPTVPSLQVMQFMCLAHGQGVPIHCQNAQLATSRPCSDTGHASFALVAFVLQVFHLSSVPTAPTTSTHPTARLGVKPSISSPALGSPSPAQKSRWKGGWDWGKLLKIGKKCDKKSTRAWKIYAWPSPLHKRKDPNPQKTAWRSSATNCFSLLPNNCWRWRYSRSPQLNGKIHCLLGTKWMKKSGSFLHPAGFINFIFSCWCSRPTLKVAFANMTSLQGKWYPLHWFFSLNMSKLEYI